MKSITPDSITGMIFALEGMGGAIVLLNGPMGCRFYHSTTSQFLSIHPLLYLPTESGEKVPVDYNYLNDWFFRQERVPCTYLDGYDYVYSTRDKVSDALEFIRDNVDHSVLGIVNSPGATLIGDNLLDLAREKLGGARVVMLESSGYSDSFEEGYSLASLELLRQVGTTLWSGRSLRSRTGRKVNLLGLSIWHRYMEGDKEELSRLLSLCGLELNAALCADCSPAEFARLPDADLNVVLSPEMGLEPARYMAEAWDQPYYVCPSLPIGFSAVEKVFREIASILGTDDGPLLAESEKGRALAWYKIHQIHQAFGKPRGVPFFVSGSPAQEKAYTAFLRDYLGMEPSGPEEAELVYADANCIAELMLKNRLFCGIEINQPGMGYVDLIPKTHMGIRGALFLIEQTLNGLMSKL
ncbi:MAG: oxidoreductase [Oscillospiraceae bacterium]|nr:oxidoreductase [Oscillospiraceae bacterium]